jgi:hypothetical protein
VLESYEKQNTQAKLKYIFLLSSVPKGNNREANKRLQRF